MVRSKASDVRAAVSPAAQGKAPPKIEDSGSLPGATSVTAPKDLRLKADVPLTSTALEAVRVSERWQGEKNAPSPGPDGRVSKQLTAPLLSALYSFWGSQNGGMTPFAFYDPFDVASGQQIGSNYDPTGNNTQGRVTVVFRGNWAQATDVARTNVQGLQLMEVA